MAFWEVQARTHIGQKWKSIFWKTDPEIQDLRSWEPAPKDCEFGDKEWGQPQDATQKRKVKCGTWIPLGKVTQQIASHYIYATHACACILYISVVYFLFFGMA